MKKEKKEKRRKGEFGRAVPGIVKSGKPDMPPPSGNDALVVLPLPLSSQS